jgi:hypothetical protein
VVNLKVAQRELLKVLSAGLDDYSARDAEYWFWQVVSCLRHEALVAHYAEGLESDG